jgi:hypothetical protein
MWAIAVCRNTQGYDGRTMCVLMCDKWWTGRGPLWSYPWTIIWAISQTSSTHSHGPSALHTLDVRTTPDRPPCYGHVAQICIHWTSGQLQTDPCYGHVAQIWPIWSTTVAINSHTITSRRRHCALGFVVPPGRSADIPCNVSLSLLFQDFLFQIVLWFLISN